MYNSPYLSLSLFPLANTEIDNMNPDATPSDNGPIIIDQPSGSGEEDPQGMA